MLIKIVGDALALIGPLLLLTAFLRIRSLGRELDSSAVSFRWRMLNIYIVFFIAAYLAYATVFWNRHEHWHDLIIIAILFFGSLFVLAVSSLALQTVLDLRRVALLEHENVTDALTGLYNRRYLDQRFSAEYASARRYHHPLSVLMLDIDHFKRLNDTYGHQAGDLALQFISGLILDSIREADVAARYGGEEFVVISPNTGIPAAGKLAERIRDRIESHELRLATAGQDQQTLRITVSVGVAELSAEMSSGAQLIKCADEALYEAKQSGRNRTVIHHRVTA
jgi:diguanylate cyclase (GGDEF)-like protein